MAVASGGRTAVLLLLLSFCAATACAKSPKDDIKSIKATYDRCGPTLGEV